MGETIAIKLINVFGWAFVGLGIAPNLFDFNDIVSLIIRVLAVGFLIVKLLNAIEGWKMKVIDRKEKQDAYRLKQKK